MTMSTSDKGPKYLLPKPTRRGYEVMPGWGLMEFGIIGVGIAIGALLAAITGLIGLPIPVVALVGVLPAALGGVLAFPGQNAPPLYHQVLAAKAYMQRPRVIRYDWQHTHGRD